MSGPGPLGGDPFGHLPFLRDVARLLGQQGGMSWDAARQIAVQLATEGRSEPNVDPLERMRLEELGRVADLQVARVTGLSTSITGSVVQVGPVTRSLWAQRTLDDHRQLLERLAASLGAANEAALADATAELDELEELDGGADERSVAAWLGELARLVNPMMLATTAGSMVGHLAQRTFGQYDLPIPRPPSDEILVVAPNLDAFASEWSLPADDLRLWVCLHELTHHAVLGVPHVRAALEQALTTHVSSFRLDPHGIEEHLGDVDVDLADPAALAELQRVLSDPEVVLGALRSPEQAALRPRLDALVAVVAGYVDHVMDVVGDGLIASYPMLTEALRRRRVEAAAADRFVERMLGLELTQPLYDRGAAFVQGVLTRSGDAGLARLWESERTLPTPAEVDAPGLWLERIDLPG